MLERHSKLTLPLIFYSIITACLTWPIASHLSSLVIGRPFEDAFEKIWYLYWYEHALWDLHVSPLFDPGIFYPTGWDLRLASLPPFYPALLSPLTRLTNPVFAYNLGLLVSCVLAAYGMFLAARILGANWWGGLLAGIAFAFYPQREVYLGGHLGMLFGSMWLPWIIYGVARAVRSPEERKSGVALALGSYALAIAGAWQFIFLGGVVLLVAAIGYWLPAVKSRSGGWARALLVGILVWSVIAVPLLIGALAASSKLGATQQFSFDDVNATSVSVERLLVPSGINPLFWNLARKTFPLHNGADSVVVLGYVPLILAAFGLRKPVTVPAKVGLALVGIGIVMMLGLTLHFWGKPIWVTVPQPVSDLASSMARPLGVTLTEGSRIQVLLPHAFLYLLVAPIRSFRACGRWGLISSLGLAILCSLGFTTVTRTWLKRKRVLAGGLACLVLLVEFNMQPLPAMTSTEQMHRPVDDWLATYGGSSAIIEYPLSYTANGQALYYTIAHGQKIVHGYGSMPPQGYRDILPRLEQWPEPSSLDLLSEIGVRYVLVDAFTGDDFENKQLPALMANPRLELVGVFPTPIGNVRQIYLFALEH
jgi:hypothetical protein